MRVFALDNWFTVTQNSIFDKKHRPDVVVDISGVEARVIKPAELASMSKAGLPSEATKSVWETGKLSYKQN